MDWLDRTLLLLGEEKLEQLKKAHVLVAGMGGVGAYTAEMLCRAGVGALTLIDGDRVEMTNLNRQLPATRQTVGQYKTEIMAGRLLDINPDLRLTIRTQYIHEKEITEILSGSFDYVADAIDTLTPKVFFICHAVQNGHRIVSSMGSGGKTDPGKVQIADISKSHHCNLARMIRKKLSKKGITDGITVVFSPEEVSPEAIRPEESRNKKSTVGTISYMPPIFGCFMASVIIRDLTEGT